MQPQVTHTHTYTHIHTHTPVRVCHFHMSSLAPIAFARSLTGTSVFCLGGWDSGSKHTHRKLKYLCLLETYLLPGRLKINIFHLESTAVILPFVSCGSRPTHIFVIHTERLREREKYIYIERERFATML